MPRTSTRFQRVATVVPLALVSAAWTTHLAGAGTVVPAGTAAQAPTTPRVLPDGTRPARAPVDYPASLSRPSEVTAGDDRFATVAATPSSTDIPAAALAAYQRAETVINAADPACRLGWQLVAAIGRVESDHGRFGGAVLDAEGVARPAIVGPVLDGRNGTAIIRDTDGGEYDGDSRYDRAVGPMQFIPSTWSVVGVDADDDGRRDPGDVDDAALAAAVYLCSGDDDLSTEAGQRQAVFRYNHSDAYVTLVLSVAGAYLEGDYTSGPGPLLSARPALPVTPAPLTPLRPPAGPPSAAGQPVRGAGPAAQPVTGLEQPAPVTPPAQPDAEPVPTEPPTEPVPTEPTEPTEPAPTEPPTEPVPTEPVPTEPPTEPVPTEPAPTEPPAEPEPGTLPLAEATAWCTDLGLVDDPAVAGDAFDTCLATYVLPAEAPAAPATPEPAPLREESRPADD